MTLRAVQFLAAKRIVILVYDSNRIFLVPFLPYLIARHVNHLACPFLASLNIAFGHRHLRVCPLSRCFVRSGAQGLRKAIYIAKPQIDDARLRKSIFCRSTIGLYSRLRVSSGTFDLSLRTAFLSRIPLPIRSSFYTSTDYYLSDATVLSITSKY